MMHNAKFPRRGTGASVRETLDATLQKLRPGRGQTTMEKTEARLAALEKQNEFLLQKLDEVRRHCRLSPVIDDQTAFINQRKDRGFAA
jgi:hypothetical protein